MGVTELPEDEGMIFIYPEEKDLTFWMHETPIKLDIICVGEDLIVNQVTEGQANDDTPIKMYGKYVIELNANSGVKEGDEVDLDDEDSEEKSKARLLKKIRKKIRFNGTSGSSDNSEDSPKIRKKKKLHV